MLDPLSASISPSPPRTSVSTQAKGGSVSVAAREVDTQSVPPMKLVPGAGFTTLVITAKEDQGIIPSNNISGEVAQVPLADHRGSRRGRRRCSQPFTTHRTFLRSAHDGSGIISPPITMGTPESQSALELDRSENAFPCTWPSCNKHFKNRSNWARHEEAVHYCPVNWVCCHKGVWPCLVCNADDHETLHHFATCATRDPDSRTFFRKDHLVRHIKDAHITPEISNLTITEELLQSWKVIDHFPSEDKLHCGFCGVVSGIWEKRQDHVWDHLKTWVCKSAWWPQRLAQPSCTYQP